MGKHVHIHISTHDAYSPATRAKRASRLAESHSIKSENATEEGAMHGGSREVTRKPFGTASDHHFDASDSFRKAADHYKAGRHAEGDHHYAAGQKSAKLARNAMYRGKKPLKENNDW